MPSIKTWEVSNRKEIVQYLTARVRTGDIIVRRSSTKGPFGIPFSYLVALLSKSKWSHASVIFFKNGKPYVMEVSDRGTLEYRLLDWLDFCVDQQFAVYRYVAANKEFEEQIEIEIQKFLEEDPDYDFTYRGEDEFYCVESVVYVFSKVGVKLVKPSLLSEVMGPIVYKIFSAINKLVYKLSGKGFDTSVRLYFVGNEDLGLLSSKKLTEVVPNNPFA